MGTFPFNGGGWTRAIAASACAASLLLSGDALAWKKKPDAPYSKGTIAKGEMKVPLFRGTAVPFELTVPATPNNCENPLELAIKWDAEDNEVKVHLTGEGALEPYPDYFREEGVNYFPNPFHPESKDVIDGRYQLWLISTAGPMLTFYYNPETLDLMGSELDFDQPPPAIPVAFPTLYLVPTPFFQPKANGDVDVKVTYAYDGMLRGDLPQFSHFFVTFPPHNLCFANPYRLDLSSLRPYLSDPRPADEARPWSDYLKGGMLFDVTAEPSDYHVWPPRVTFLGTHQGSSAVAGGVPDGWSMNIDAAFMGVAPPIRRWIGAGKCEDTFEPQHTPNINFCELMPH
ncbi:MAG: hypothetical protein KC636_26130 [Myxococcales bacterium]|nr:hypothetical protein [Myxococcales bacterium]